MKLTTFPIFILILLIGVDGCSNSNSPANAVSAPSNAVSWTIPNPGSYFITVVSNSHFPSNLDTFFVTGGPIIKGGESTITLRGASFNRYESISYGSNGDISYYPGGLDSDPWSHFPTGGGTSVDSLKTIINGRNHSYELLKRYRFYNGTGTMNINGIGLPTIKIHQVDSTFDFDMQGKPLSQPGAASSDYNFIPSLGFLGTHVSPDGSLEALVSYEVN